MYHILVLGFCLPVSFQCLSSICHIHLLTIYPILPFSFCLGGFLNCAFPSFFLFLCHTLHTPIVHLLLSVLVVVCNLIFFLQHQVHYICILIHIYVVFLHCHNFIFDPVVLSVIIISGNGSLLECLTYFLSNDRANWMLCWFFSYCF